MLHENREKYIKEIQIKHDKDKELLKRKITGYNEIVTKKESMILNYQKIEEKKNNQLLQKSYRIENLEIEVKKQNDLIDKKNKDVEFFIKSLAEKELEFKRLKEKLKKQ